jgi:hypothetical protein
MATPLERLDKIVNANTPREIVFKVVPSPNDSEHVILEGVVTKPMEVREIPEDVELQRALANEVSESWDQDGGKYYINSSADTLWRTIQRTIFYEYGAVSNRCNATKRKTEDFIRNIKIDDKHLANYLLQVFIKIRAPSWAQLATEDRETLFEQFESLRRTYGKRK